MIEMIGNFDLGREKPSDAQWTAARTVVAAIQRAFGLPPQAVRFHNEMTDQKTCPGTFFDKQAVVAEIEARQQELGSAPRAADGPLADGQRMVHRLLQEQQVRSRSRTSTRDDRPLGEEIAECTRLTAASADLTRSADAAPAERGAGGAETITPDMFRTLRGHLIHLRNGRFVEDGPFATTHSDVEEMVEGIKTWAKHLSGDATPRILIWAHGGLASAEHSMAYSWRMHRWWMNSNIYPIYFIWETGVLETVMQMIEQRFGPAERGFFGELDDRLVEALVRAIGQPFWEHMKDSAENAADARKDRGAFALSKLLEGLNKAKIPAKPEIHAAGHSAGAIFHSYFLREMGERGVPVESLSLLAPACTVDLFNANIVPLVRSEAIRRFRMFALDRGHELADPTVPVYDKSLLYLVSRGFERARNESILGLEESVRRDRDLLAFFGIGGGKASGEVVWCPTPQGTPDGARSTATVHGAFDDDRETLLSLRASILGDADPGEADPPPAPPTGRGTGRLFRPFSEVFPYMPQPKSATSAPGGTMAPQAPEIVRPGPGGRLLALSIGIDDYQGHSDLAGCVADSKLWTEVLRRLGFDVSVLRDRDATRAGMESAIAELIGRARPGDALVLHYSGHGTRLPDFDGDEADGDAQDEALVPHDGPSHGEYFIDDDIRRILAGLHPAVDFTFFADCCHSGTVSRFSFGTQQPRNLKIRYLKTDDEMIARYQEARRRMGAARSAPEGGEEQMGHVLFAACKDSQTAKESDGYGWFSKTATDLLQAPGGLGSNRAFLERVEHEFVRRGHSGFDQTPQLEGRIAHKDRAMFGGLVR